MAKKKPLREVRGVDVKVGASSSKRGSLLFRGKRRAIRDHTQIQEKIGQAPIRAKDSGIHIWEGRRQ